MALMSLIEEKTVKIPLESTDKEGVLRELVDVLASAGKVGDTAALLTAVKYRESLGSTGLADGIAVPHGKTAAITSLGLVIGIAPAGIDFESEDGHLSKIFFLLAAPPDQAGPHIEALAEIARLSHSRALLKALVSAESAQEVVELLRGD